MPTLPNKPRPGTSLKDANLPDVIGKLIDYCRSITPRSSPTVKAFISSGGTTLTVQRSPIQSGQSSTWAYSSFFRVVDASEYQEDGTFVSCRVGVTRGDVFHQSWEVDANDDPIPNLEICGSVKINGSQGIPVLSIPHTGLYGQPAQDGVLTEKGVYTLWLHSWIGSVEEQNPIVEDSYVHTRIIIGDVDDDTPPDNPFIGVAWANQCIGRVTVGETVAVPAGPNNVPPAIPAHLYISQITQDYLRGGEHTELIFGQCDDVLVQCPSCT